MSKVEFIKLLKKMINRDSNVKIVTLEFKNDADLDLLVTLTKRLDGEILNIEHINREPGCGPVYWLNELAKKGGIKDFPDPSKWQKEQRIDKKLLNR